MNNLDIPLQIIWQDLPRSLLQKPKKNIFSEFKPDSFTEQQRETFLGGCQGVVTYEPNNNVAPPTLPSNHDNVPTQTNIHTYIHTYTRTHDQYHTWKQQHKKKTNTKTDGIEPRVNMKMRTDSTHLREYEKISPRNVGDQKNRGGRGASGLFVGRIRWDVGKSPRRRSSYSSGVIRSTGQTYIMSTYVQARQQT